jgi:thiamine-phosphate diphosphorylase
LVTAVQWAKNALSDGLANPIVIGRGNGYADAAPRLNAKASIHFSKKVERFRGIYVLTDPNIRPDRTERQIVSAALDGGAKIVQYRAKNISVQDAVNVSRELADIAREHNALFIVNDRVDIAKASYADGVHLGPDDIDPCDAHYQLGELIGVSVATVEEAAAAAPFASYFGVGAVYGSKTKLDAGAPIGVERLREIKAAFPHIPIVAIGGITRDNLAAVRDTGVEAAAVVSAVIAADDMRAATAELVAIWNDR